MKAKKALGQNWLISGSAVAKIIEAGRVVQADLVLEIGPGQGVLTEKLLATGCQVIAIEKDQDLIPTLTEKFAPEIDSGRLVLLNEDVLDFDITLQNFAKQTHPNFVQQNLGGQDLSGQETKYHLPNTIYKLVANIPYYLTGQIIRQFLTTTNPPSLMVLMLQKEVAERIARDKKESLLSLSVKAYGQPHYIKTVPAGAFRPIPKVDSAILLIDQISRQHFPDAKSENKFFDLLHRGFRHKRQLLKNNLSLSAEQLEACGIPAKARAENLSLADWFRLLKI